MEDKVQLGDLAQDVITGFRGIVTGHSDYLTGCDQFLLQPQIPHDSDTTKFPDGRWFDENRLRVLEKHSVSEWRTDGARAAEADGGADIPAPIK